MDVRLSPISMQTPTRALAPSRLTPGAGIAAGGGTGAVAGGGFSSVLKGALSSVSAAQNHASALQREVQMDNPNVSLEETMVAIQKAQIGFAATLNVRNRMVQAYNDIMNMQV